MAKGSDVHKKAQPVVWHMKNRLKHRSIWLITGAISLALALTSCLDENVGNLEITGIVYDKSTNKPIEGAYVMANYMRSRGTIGGHSSSYCYMTRGMYTGADGKFHLPVTAIDYGSPQRAVAIKPGYYFGDDVIHKFDIRKDPKAWFSNRDVYLIPQKPEKPNTRIAPFTIYCDGAETNGDATASVEFMRIQIAELKKYGGAEQSIEAKNWFIEQMSALPDKPLTRTNK
jgi:hypothetical protein